MTDELTAIVDVQVTAETRFPTRKGFGTPLIAAYLTGFVDRVKTVSQTSELAALGIVEGNGESGKVFAAVQAMFAQNPRPQRVKIGRRAGAPSQSIRLTPTDPVEGHETTVTIGGVPFAFTSTVTATVNEITTALELLINADVDAILATGATSAAIQTLTGVALDGAIGTGALTPPRNVTLVLDAHADWDATTAVVTGKDAAGRTISEDFAIPDNGGATVTGAKLFASVSQIVIPAQSGVGGTFTAGVGTIFSNAELEVTASDDTTHLTIAADNLGDWFSFNGFDSRLEALDLTAEPATTLATDLAAMNLEDSDWYGLTIADAQSQPQIEPAATWAETVDKFYLAHSFDTIVTQDTDTDVASQLQLAAVQHTKVHFQRNGSGLFPDAGWMAVVFPNDPGSVTWEFKEIALVTVDSLNTDQITELRAKNASYYVRVRGKNVTQYSRMAGGEWMDVIRFISWVVEEVGVDVFDELSSGLKTPFTGGGISSVVGRVRNVGRKGQRVGGLDPNQELIVVGPELADLDPADIANRELKGVTFDWRLAGAIHFARIRGNVSV